jgi:cytoskeletal protein RodZ
MIGRKSGSDTIGETERPQGFDSFELRLGDVMRGERATMGKSLLDVQRELRIKASYIAAIENCDPDAFDTPGFIAGYVRSYARYLNMNPDEAFAAFCAESGFSVAHGMSAQASGTKKSMRDDRAAPQTGHDIFAGSGTPFTPIGETVWSRVEPGAIGSLLVLLGLIGGIGFGGYSILQEVQRVQVAPVEQAPQVLAELDPLEGAVTRSNTSETSLSAAPVRPSPEALDRLYRPQALDVPVLVARDAAIANIDPRNVGNFAQPGARANGLSTTEVAAVDRPVDISDVPAPVLPRVVEETLPALVIVASAETWLRVRSVDGTTIFEAVMQPGDSWEAPLTEQTPTLHTGNAGGVYFAMGGRFFGPVGQSGEVYRKVPLSVAGLQETLEPVDPADLQGEEGLIRYAKAQGLLPAGQ